MREATVPHRRAGWSSSRLRRDLTGWAFISPWVIGFLVFTAFPFLASMYLSLTEYNLASPPKFVGLENFSFMFLRDRVYWTSMRVTWTYAAITIPLGMVQSVAIALLLNQRIRGIAFFRTAFYVPGMISSVGWMLVWTYLLAKNGAINWALALIGVEGPSYLNSTTWALPALALMGLFSVGSAMLIMLAALQGVPEHLYEAVEIDGGGEVAKFRHVTLPQISPALFYNLVMSLIGVLQSWQAAYLMTDGGPRHATLFYGLHLYRNAFEYFKMGYASALGWVAFIIVLALTGVNFLASKYWVFYEGG
ncbi:MAG: sugar ABC transporter permease [Anaerolineae bacterium]|nr:sugar ABC transporter permease [Anaerolineae bacterium]